MKNAYRINVRMEKESRNIILFFPDDDASIGMISYFGSYSFGYTKGLSCHQHGEASHGWRRDMTIPVSKEEALEWALRYLQVDKLTPDIKIVQRIGR